MRAETPEEIAWLNAVDNGWIDPVRQYIAGGGRVDVQDSGGWAAAHYAAYNGDSILLACIIESDADMDIRNQIGASPLHLAVRGKNLACVEMLVSMGVDLNLQDNIGRTALHMASENNDIPTIRLLLDCHADRSITDLNKKLPKHYTNSRAVKCVLSKYLNPLAEVKKPKKEHKRYGKKFGR